ncbi:hypothetical protein [Roseibium sp. M-1]
MLLPEPQKLETHRYQLVEGDRAVRGQSVQERSLSGWIELSEAAVIPLSAELMKDDAELTSFHRSEAETHSYHYVSFNCSFGPGEKQKFEKAWLEATLASSDGGDISPIAWSMNPKDAWDSVEQSAKASIGAKFELISSGLEASQKADVKSYFLRAYREKQSNPYWEFRSTDTADIDGTYRFHMITRSQKGARGSGSLKLSAVVQKRRYFLLTASEAAEAPPEITFKLSG